MKKLYVAAFTILLASSCTGMLHADLAFSNWTNIPLSISVITKKSKNKHDSLQ